MSDLTEKYPHIVFKRNWSFNNDISLLQGEIKTYMSILSLTPILPEEYAQLLEVTLIKGVKGTVAIEGNTLSEVDIHNIKKGYDLPPDKKYQEIEVKNVIDALNDVKSKVMEGFETHITPKLILEFHKNLTKNLGDRFEGIPGTFATRGRIVGNYKAPDHSDVPALVNNLCEWLLDEFNFPKNRDINNAIIQAIVTHYYLAAIHPFNDGNGRTGRLIEFYILLRGGVPNIFAHFLSNYYNETRDNYYYYLQNSNKTRDLTEFIHYALNGFKLGLEKKSGLILDSLKKILWKKYVHDYFEKDHFREKVGKRMKSIPMDMELDKTYKIQEMLEISPKVAKLYANYSKQVFNKDIKLLVSYNILIYKDGIYKANTDLLTNFMPQIKPIEL